MALRDDPEQHELSAIRRLVPSFAGLDVLEIGCGSGRLTRRYAAEASSVIAIDPDEDDIEALARELPHVDARAIGVEELDLPAHAVDVVVFAWSL